MRYEKTCKTITLKWKIPLNNGGLPVYQYKITAKPGVYTENVAAESDEMEHEIPEEFEPETLYTVKIQARTKAGLSGSEEGKVTTNKFCKSIILYF